MPPKIIVSDYEFEDDFIIEQPTIETSSKRQAKKPRTVEHDDSVPHFDVPVSNEADINFVPDLEIDLNPYFPVLEELGDPEWVLTEEVETLFKQLYSTIISITSKFHDDLTQPLFLENTASFSLSETISVSSLTTKPSNALARSITGFERTHFALSICNSQLVSFLDDVLGESDKSSCLQLSQV
ncbi:hypothetical protein BLNAU_20912 [Blattamonas nauphoetae]|uniref:Uncharacterized protein n=1 Tax=Blattamonas nauphoetae TaxID=2049346 RepID=A0ABQ9WXC1_9EUKA|nr:hypothetical protein BLNAU_20912 [Blattamonas nauphoetae]